jgi:hypothetical protein
MSAFQTLILSYGKLIIVVSIAAPRARFSYASIFRNVASFAAWLRFAHRSLGEKNPVPPRRICTNARGLLLETAIEIGSPNIGWVHATAFASPRT